MPLGNPGGYARGQGGGAQAWARPMNAGPQGMNPGQGAVGVSPRFRPNPGMQRVSPPFQKFQNNWGPRTAGFQVPGNPQRSPPNFNPALRAQAANKARGGSPAFAALPPAKGPGRFNKFM